MECPIDGTILETHSVHSINVEECPQCRGLWFEQGELRKVKDEADPDLNWLDFDLWSDQSLFQVDWSSRNCPMCRKVLATISYADTGVTVEYWTDEHGIWLDKGEFKAIIKALETEVISKSASDYIKASLEEAKEIVVGSEGFVSEWKDFLTVTRFLQYRILAENPQLVDLLISLQHTTPFR